MQFSGKGCANLLLHPLPSEAMSSQPCSDCTRLNTQVCANRQVLDKGGKLEQVLKCHRHLLYVLNDIIMHFVAHSRSVQRESLCQIQDRRLTFILQQIYLKEEQFLNTTGLFSFFHLSFLSS